MGYKKHPNIPKAKRAAKRRQTVGQDVVPRYAWSPYTAEPGHSYTWYAEVTLKEYIQSPPGVNIKNMTIHVFRGNFLEFRDYVDSGEAMERIESIVVGYGGQLESIDGYWRSTDGENK